MLLVTFVYMPCFIVDHELILQFMVGFDLQFKK